MVGNSARTRAAGILLGLLAGVVFGAPEGLVLCIGDEGHIEIETAVELIPCGVPLRDGGTFGAPPVEACSDTSLVQTALPPGVDHGIATLIESSSEVLSPAPALPPQLSRSRIGTYFMVATLRAHRTIVLLV